MSLAENEHLISTISRDLSLSGLDHSPSSETPSQQSYNVRLDKMTNNKAYTLLITHVVPLLIHQMGYHFVLQSQLLFPVAVPQ